jgi:hypothetical protein
MALDTNSTPFFRVKKKKKEKPHASLPQAGQDLVYVSLHRHTHAHMHPAFGAPQEPRYTFPRKRRPVDWTANQNKAGKKKDGKTERRKDGKKERKKERKTERKKDRKKDRKKETGKTFLPAWALQYLRPAGGRSKADS